MWFQKKSLRHLAVVDEPSTRREPLWKLNPWQARIGMGATVFFILALAIGFMPTQARHLGPGGRLRQAIFSPVTFTIPNRAALTELQQHARLSTPPIVRPNTGSHLFTTITRDLGALPSQLQSVAGVQALPATLKTQYPEMSAKALAWLKGQARHILSYNKLVARLVLALQTYPIVTQADFNRIAASSAPNVMLGRSSALLSINNLKILGTDAAFAPLVRRCFPPVVQPCINAYLARLNRPTFVFDAAATQQQANANAAKIPAATMVFHRGDLLIPAGNILTAGDRQLLQAARSSFLTQLNRSHPWEAFADGPARGLLLLILTLVATLYVLSRPRELASLTRTAVFAILILLTMLIPKVAESLGFSHLTYLLALLPVLLAAILFTIVGDGRLAWGLATINALLVAWAIHRGLTFVLTALAGIAVFTFTLTEIRTRSKLLKVGLLAALVMIAALGAGTFSAGLPMHAAAINWKTLTIPAPALALEHQVALCILAAIASAFLALGLLPLLERSFHVVTAMTLLELSDTNHPLLRRMAIEAPGTFNHSLIVGIMAEAAGRSIGAQALLCRVGAYYHDIGKLVKPEYFIENMAGRPNRHDKLAPTMSHLIIIGHVKDGIELSREFRLPAQVCNFIAEHHGTTLVEPFFVAARDRQAKQAVTRGIHGQVAEADFRYPGPKPQSRETAVVMICDSVESMVRAMPEATAGRIESAAHQLINKRLLDGQFEHCDLTLVELSKIEESIVRTLAGVYHGRLAYPKPLALVRPA